MSITLTSDTKDPFTDDPDDLTDEQMAESRAGTERGLERRQQGVSKRWHRS